ncbi:unnamed protein product [Danaus chrysippus]|uniref:(African queen) hypothetical protein n=1 Tax=Danaus chrysippus TaxID=151541 RepID=A0A8J2R6E1_9NEOP|nr:unnamed protein product [Danaus chrysippus]
MTLISDLMEFSGFNEKSYRSRSSRGVGRRVERTEQGRGHERGAEEKRAAETSVKINRVRRVVGEGQRGVFIARPLRRAPAACAITESYIGDDGRVNTAGRRRAAAAGDHADYGRSIRARPLPATHGPGTERPCTPTSEQRFTPTDFTSIMNTLRSKPSVRGVLHELPRSGRGPRAARRGSPAGG